MCAWFYSARRQSHSESRPAAGNPFKSRPSRALRLTVLGGVLAGVALVPSPLGHVLGFAALPSTFFGVLVVIVVTHQVLRRHF
jgi:hypothetical protein